MLSLEEISARMEIHDVLMRYCRGIDRRDADLIRSAYFEDAVDTRSYYKRDSTADNLARRAVEGFGDLPDYSQHHTTNEIIDLDLDNDLARVESYVIACHPVGPETSLLFAPEDGKRHLRFVGGRYLDRFERRDGEWRIARRVSMVDWSRADLLGDELWDSFREELTAGGIPDDPSFTDLGFTPGRLGA